LSKKQNLRAFQEELGEQKEIERKKKIVEEEDKKSYYYLNFDGISNECYEWWKVVLKSHNLRERDRVPVWMKELLQKW
jgi:hypothetical protein